MLQSMRSSSGSWIAKGILGLLVLSFLGWGIADYAHVGMHDTTVARVGDREINIIEFTQRYQQTLRQQQLLSIDPSVAEQLGLAGNVLQGMTTRILYEEEAIDLDLTASDGMVRQAIQQRPEFAGLGGQFDRGQFNFALSSLGVSEADFVELQRRELAADGFIGSVLSGSAAPAAMTDLLYRYFGERRDARYITLTPDAVAGDAAAEIPSEADLEAFFEERGEDFRRPELRSLRYVSITPEAVAEGIEIADAVLEDVFDQRRGEFIQPEQRGISQIVFPSEADAQAAAEALAGLEGDAITVKIDELGLSLIELGVFGQDGIPNPALGEAAFALPGTGVTGAFEGTFGWSIAVVTEIVEGEDPTLDDVVDQLRADLQLDEAYDEVFALGSSLEDAYGAGSSLATAAQEVGLEAVVVEAVDAGGLGPDGQAITDLPAGLSFLRTAFDLDDGEVSFLETTEANAQFMVEVISITPSAIPPLEQVRAAAILAWQEEQQLLAVETLADTLLEQLDGGADLATLAAEISLEVIETIGFSRDGQTDGAGSLPSVLAQDLFAASDGDAVVTADGDRFHVSVLTATKAAGTSAPGDEDLRDSLQSAIARGMGQDLVDQWGQALEGRISVETFPEVYTQVYQY